MPSAHSAVTDRLRNVRLEDVVLTVACAIAVLTVVVTQLLTIIVFDSVGLDRVVPDPVMTQFVPALLVAVLPGAYAAYRYDRTVAGIVGGLVFVAALALASWTITFYGLCGGC